MLRPTFLRLKRRHVYQGSLVTGKLVMSSARHANYFSASVQLQSAQKFDKVNRRWRHWPAFLRMAIHRRILIGRFSDSSSRVAKVGREPAATDSLPKNLAPPWSNGKDTCFADGVIRVRIPAGAPHCTRLLGRPTIAEHRPVVGHTIQLNNSPTMACGQPNWV